jgi:SAM-dependent methyltransferase
MPNMWDQRFSEPGYAYGTEPNDFLREVATRIPAGPVVSIGDGEGRNGVFLALLGHPVTSVDGSSVGLAKADVLAKERGVALTTRHADLAEYDFAPGGYAAIVSIFCHLPAALRRDVHRRASAALARGGQFILEAYTPKQLEHKTGGPPVLDLLVTLEDLREDFAGLTIVHGLELERDIHEGRLHRGKSAVVQLVAQKD